MNKNSIRLSPEGVIEFVVYGKQTGETTAHLKGEIQALADQRRADGKPVLLMADLRHIRMKDATSGARLEGRQIFEIPVDAWAIVGKGSIVVLAAYLARLAKKGIVISYFRSTAAARRWLISAPTHQESKPASWFYAPALVTGLIGLIGLAGWQWSNIYLTSWVGGYRPINPVAAVGLIVLGVGLAGWHTNKLRLKAFMAVLLLIIGTGGLLSQRFNYLLYSNQLHQNSSTALMASSGAVCFILAGLFLLLVHTKKQIYTSLMTLCGVLIVMIALANIFGQLYAHDVLQRNHSDLVAALSLSTGFLVAGSGLLTQLFTKRWKIFVGSIGRLGWLTVALFWLMQWATYASWNQTIVRNKTQSKNLFQVRRNDLEATANARIDSYNNMLNGYRGFFESSSKVSQGEFDHYSNTLKLNENYPGLRSVAYIAAVKDADIPKFVAEQRADTSLNPEGRPNFAIQSLTKDPVHYIGTYVSDTPNSTGLGRDLSSIPGRSKLYGDAIASGQSSTSGTVTFNASATTAAQQGFIITMPVHYEGTSQSNGLVIVTFNYKDFFPALLTDTNLAKDIDVSVADGGSKTTIYQIDNTKGSKSLSNAFFVPIANGGWQVSMQASDNFGINKQQLRGPQATIWLGEILAGFILMLFVVQVRARKQALDLADAITIDLQTERNRTIELNQRDEAILGGIGEGLLMVTSDGKIERVNDAAAALLGCSEAALINKDFAEVVEAYDDKDNRIAASERPLAHALQSGKTTSANLYYRHTDGHKFPVQLNIAPVKLNGKIIGAIEIFRDITKDIELDKQKDEFVSLTSHQLRTPLTAIRLFSEMLLSGDVGKLSKGQREYIDNIATSTKRMINLVGDFLNTSRIELGRLRVEPEPTDVTAFVKTYVKEFEPVAAEKRITLDFASDKLPQVPLDQNLYGQVVHNLVTNAVRYSPENSTITIRLTKQAKEFTLTVSDKGIGIPKNAQAKIFQRFFRAENAVLKEGEGSGLGLYLIKRIAQLVGGQVSFESEEGKGTTFHVIMPLEGMHAKAGEVSLAKQEPSRNDR